MVHQELSQIFETDRQTQIRATTELRGEIQCVMDRLVESAKAPAEDRYARDCCLKVEQGLMDFRTSWNHKIGELRALAPKGVEELRQVVQNESESRRELAQAVDAYRISHLQTSTDLRGDVDRILEKVNRTESYSGNVNLREDLDKTVERLNRLESLPNQLSGTDLGIDFDKTLERLGRLESQANTDLRGDLDKALERLTRLESLSNKIIQPAKGAASSLLSDGSSGTSLGFSTLRSGAGDNAGSVVSTAVGSLRSDDRGASSLLSSPLWPGLGGNAVTNQVADRMGVAARTNLLPDFPA